MARRYVCIHGHFYQPPRENPWLEAVELQDSAYPYHDWNERVAAEAYATNATSRILDPQGRIAEIVNNYARISFNFGPTLLCWLETHAPEVYRAVLEADQASQEHFAGHGSALAQPYNHMIMPLANRRDKYTQVVWGLFDFVHRFGRMPEGMWLPETAVDLETLDIMAQVGIRFTILAPHQACRVRPIGEEQWRDVSGGRIDPTMAYLLRLSSERSIFLFFYDSEVSHEVAFGGLLREGRALAARLLERFSEERPWPQLVHIATDGETYGHHHRFGDMALASALHQLESESDVELVNYGEFLERHPPSHEVEICENTSWSCAHGIERWRSDCGCTTGGHPDWNQSWRAPLRRALDWLRDRLVPAYEHKAALWLHDPWKARDNYVKVILDRSPENLERYLEEEAGRKLEQNERIAVLKLLELQRHAMLMYTSCGWFFDELSRLETVQIIQYAGRVLQLAEELFGNGGEEGFLELLEQAKSNIAEHGDGRQIYLNLVKPSMVRLEKVGAHYAVSSLFEEYPEEVSIYCYQARREEYWSSETGRIKLVVARATVTSKITTESQRLCLGVLHWGDHNLHCGVRAYQGQEAYQTLQAEVSEAFARADFSLTLQLLDRHFGASTYSLTSLFRDEQRRILDLILESSLQQAETSYRQLYEYHAPLLRFLKYSKLPPPKALYIAAEFVVNASLRQAFEADELDLEAIRRLLEEAREEGLGLDEATLEYALRKTLERRAEQLLAAPTDLALLQELEQAVGVVDLLPFEVNLWKVQNLCYEIGLSILPALQKEAEQRGREAARWLEHFRELAAKLSLRIA